MFLSILSDTHFYTLALIQNNTQLDEKCGVATIVQVVEYNAGMRIMLYDINIICWQQLLSERKLLEMYRVTHTRQYARSEKLLVRIIAR